MLHLLEALPILGKYLVGPLLDVVHVTVDVAQFIVGI